MHKKEIKRKIPYIKNQLHLSCSYNFVKRRTYQLRQSHWFVYFRNWIKRRASRVIFWYSSFLSRKYRKVYLQRTAGHWYPVSGITMTRVEISTDSPNRQSQDVTKKVCCRMFQKELNFTIWVVCFFFFTKCSLLITFCSFVIIFFSQTFGGKFRKINEHFIFDKLIFGDKSMWCLVKEKLGKWADVITNQYHHVSWECFVP